MIYLLLSIILSSLLFASFKWLEQKGIALLPVIAGNYVACIITGLLLSGGPELAIMGPAIPLSCLALGALFFGTFYMMGYSSAHIGVGITGASSKMSLIIPVLFGALILGEELNAVKIIALLLALFAVFLMSYSRGNTIQAKMLLLPLFIFIGSGIIDTALNILQLVMREKGLGNGSAVTLIFTGAVLSASIAMAFKWRERKPDLKSLGYGLIIGVPNYFSIYFLVMGLSCGTWPSNQFYMLNNTGIMGLCFILGWLGFGEKITLYKGIGLTLAVISIYLVLFA